MSSTVSANAKTSVPTISQVNVMNQVLLSRRLPLFSCICLAIVGHVSHATEPDEGRPALEVSQAFVGVGSNLEVHECFRVTDAESWQQKWYQHHAIGVIRGRNPHPVPQVNFEESMVIGIIESGKKFPHGIKVTRLEQQREDGRVWLAVDYQRNRPGPDADNEGSNRENRAAKVYGFFVIPRTSATVVVRRQVKGRLREVARFAAMDEGTASPQTPREDPAHRHAITTRRGLNVGFAFDPGQGNYDGIVGSPRDVWNFVDIGTTSVDYLRHPDASGSSARLRVTRHDGEWGIAGEEGIFHGYIYHNCRCVDLEVQILDLEPGKYDAYVYAHGDASDQNALIEILVNDISIGKKPTALGRAWESRSEALTVGIECVKFRIQVAAGQSVRIISHRDGSEYSMFNAIQVVPVASDPDLLRQ